MTSSALLGAAEGAVERNDLNPTQRHGNVQGTDGGVLALFQVQNATGCPSGSVWLVEWYWSQTDWAGA